MIADDIRALLDHYPKIFFACHTRHVRDGQHTLSARQASILDHLDDVDAISLTDLASHMGVTLSTMSLGADRLERQGYLVRTRDPADGRRIGLRLTKAGLRIKEKEKVLDPELLRGMLGRLTSAERKEAIAGLALLARAAAESMHEKVKEARGARKAREARDVKTARSES
jgi:DNA-binding MarR family transcriptional regulator